MIFLIRLNFLFPFLLYHFSRQYNLSKKNYTCIFEITYTNAISPILSRNGPIKDNSGQIKPENIHT